MSDNSRPNAATTLVLCAAMHGVGGGLGWSLVPPLMPDLAKDLALTHAMGGVIWGAASLGIAVAAPLGGLAVDRLGPRRVAGVAMLVGAIACALRPLAHGANGGVVLAVLMLFFGLHIGFVAPAIPKALATVVPAHKLGRANGIAIASYTLMTALAVATARGIVAPLLGGWRPLMIVASGLMAAVGVLWLLLVKDAPAAKKAPGALAAPQHATFREVLGLGRIPAMRTVAAIHFCLFGGYLALLGLLPRALLDAGLPPTRAALAVAAWLFFAAIANVAGPTLSDRVGRRRPFIIFGAIVAGVSLSLFALAPRTAPLPFLVVAALGGGAFAPLLLTLPSELREIGPSRAGGALGLLMLVGQVGGFLLPTLSGWVLQARGFSAAIFLLAMLHLAIPLFARKLPETGARGRAETPVAPDARNVSEASPTVAELT